MYHFIVHCLLNLVSLIFKRIYLYINGSHCIYFLIDLVIYYTMYSWIYESSRLQLESLSALFQEVERWNYALIKKTPLVLLYQPPWDAEVGDTYIIHYTYGCDYTLKVLKVWPFSSSRLLCLTMYIKILNVRKVK